MAQQLDENGIPIGNLMDNGPMQGGVTGNYGSYGSQTPLSFQPQPAQRPAPAWNPFQPPPGTNTGITGGLGQPAPMPQQVTPQATGLPPGSVAPSSTWNTKGFTAPAFAPQNFNAGNLFGTLDQTKLNDPNYQDPKYALLRGLSNFDSTPEGLIKALPTIQQMYPGTTQVGKDKLQVPGVGLIDVGPAFGAGGGLGWGYNLITGPNGESAAADTILLAETEYVTTASTDFTVGCNTGPHATCSCTPTSC